MRVAERAPQNAADEPFSRPCAEYIVDYLELEGVPYAFTVCGHGNIGLLDAFHDRSTIRLISMHREDAAGYAADAFFRVAHRPVATITSCGPGSTNLLIALGAALLDSSTFLAITGNVPTSQFNRGPFQELGRHFQADFPSAAQPFVKRSFQPTRPDMLGTALRRAFGLMCLGRPGPINLDIPLNVFREETSDPLPSPAAWRLGTANCPLGDPDSVKRAARLLEQADRPVIVAGHGAILGDASECLTAFAEATGIPVATSPHGKGVIDERHPLALGALGRNGTFPANQATRHADVILALGTGFDDRATSSWEPGSTYSIPPTRLIQVDLDPTELGSNFPVEVGIVADIAGVLGQLSSLVPSMDRSRHEGWLGSIDGWSATWQEYLSTPASSVPGVIDPGAAVTAIRKALPDDGILVSDVGIHHNWLVQRWETRKPRTLLQSWGFAAMGFGVAGVLGAKLAAPDRPCVAVCGDGGFLMTSHTVATAVEYHIPAVWVVWNNGGYISIRDQQLAYFGEEIATRFVDVETGEPRSTDFAAMARSMGAKGVCVDSDAALSHALRSALDGEQPTVIEAYVARDVFPAATGGWTLPPHPPSQPTFLGDQ